MFSSKLWIFRNWTLKGTPLFYQLKVLVEPRIGLVEVCGPHRACLSIPLILPGDYDGDKAFVIWQPELVEHFENAHDLYADPPEDMSQYFERDVEKVSDFFEEIQDLPQADAISELQDRLLASLRTRTDVGAYSTCHERAVYKLGYSHPTTRRLAFM